ncbi:TrmH family RNA methyltransferase [Bifidobacterium moukalabense]|uniref:TrmH family RNA methyltransferase n=1 Tax=Bifidobacterium moukalabense TaxID=1333651 RepID=UPI0010F451A7|nr:RNA methyltransferase [Bifidobacterium moukalabense]
MPITTEVIANPKAGRIRRVAELTERKGRKRAGRFLVEGPQSVRELLTWYPDVVQDLYVEAIGTEPDAPFLTDTVAQMAGKAMQAGAYVHKVTHAVMRHMSSDSQGVLAVADMRGFLDAAGSVESLDDDAMVAAFWQVRDPGNAGTVIRSADAAGCAAVMFVDECVDIFNPKVIRSTAGSLFHLPVLAMGTDEFFAWCDDYGLAVYAADVYGTDARLPEPLTDVLSEPRTTAGAKAVLFGNEARGLTSEVLNRTDRIVSIPIYGKAESLNLGTSAAVMLLSLAMSSHVERM